MGDQDGADRRYSAVVSGLPKDGQAAQDSPGEKLPLKRAALRLYRKSKTDLPRYTRYAPFQADICDKKR